MLVRVGACHLLAGIDRHRPVAEIAQRRFDDHERVLQALAHKSGSWIARGITNPAATTVATWAAELVGGRNIDGLAALAPASIFSQLSERAAYRVSFAGTGTVMVPSRSKTPAINGSFVGEGGAIPVRRLGLTAAPMTPKKAAVITYFSSEIAAYSAPNIEGVVKQAVAEDTGLMLDTLLLDSVAGDAIRPAGLLNGVTPLPASPGGGIDALAGDIEDLAAMIATTGPLLDPVLITDAASALVVDLIAPGTVPLISGSNVAADTLIMVDAGDLAIGGSGNLDFEISRDALINAADPALPVSSGGAMASPLTSLWQQDLVGLKMVEDITWQMRRPGRVAVITGCTW
jgi:hypothetical protein